MAKVYGEVPASAVIDIPTSIPTGMLYRIRQIQGCNREQVKLVPISGQGSVRGGQKIIVTLPPNSLVDLSTFEMIFNGYTDHGGNAASGNVDKIVQARYFPRNTASLIDALEIKINGSSKQRIDQYGYIYNIFHDFTAGDDSIRKNRIGQNADPSSKTWNFNGLSKRKNLYPIGINAGSGHTITNHTAKDYGTYCIRQWLGLLGGNGSTSIIHTGMLGDVTIEITLAGGGVLCQSAAPSSLTSYTNTTSVDGSYMMDLTTLTNTSNAAYSTTSLIASEGTNYTLDTISFNITKYSMPDSFYNALASVLASGQTYQIYYPNYSVFQGIPTTTKSTSTRFSIACKSLDMVIGTFQVPSKDTITYPMLGPTDYTAYAIGAATAANGEEGHKTLTYDNLINYQYPLTFNNSRYFLRNGDGLTSARWVIGGVPLNSENMLEMYNGVLRAFNNSQVDMLGGIYRGCCSLNHFRSQFFSHILKLNAQTDNEVFTVSGVNASENSIDIVWETTGGDSSTNFDSRIGGTTSPGAVPIIIAAYSSHIDVSANRNIVFYV